MLTNTFNINLEKNSQWQLSFTAYDDGSVAFNMLSVESSVWWDNQEYIIKQFQPDYSNGFTTFQITAVHVAYEVSRIRQRETKTGTLTYTVDDVLSFYLKNNSLGFTWQVLGDFGKEQITDLGNGSGKDMLDKVISTWPDAVFYPDNKNIRIYQHDSIAKKLGNRIDYLHDTPELKLSYDSTNIVNQVMASGKQKETEGDTDKVQYYFAPFLVTNDTSVGQWGLHPGDDISDERFTDATAMKEYALSQLSPEPTLSIDATQMINEEPTLCEIRRLENRKDEFVTEVEIVAYTYYPLDETQATSITLNNRAKTILNYQSAQQKQLMKSLKLQNSHLSEAIEMAKQSRNDIQAANIDIKAMQENSYPWEGKSVTVLGDSITYGQINGSSNHADPQWTEYLATIAKFKNVANKGIAGAKIAVTAAAERIEPISITAESVSGQDMVIVFGGINDFVGVGKGLGDMSSTDVTTFYGALKHIVSTLKANNPTAKLVFITPMKQNSSLIATYDSNGNLQKNSDGYTQLDFVSAIQNVCGYYSISVIDMYGNSDINPYLNGSNFQDGLNPTQTGYEILGRQIARIINTL